MVIWVTGLSGSGKTTLCTAIWQLLKPVVPELVSLDGDTIRRSFDDQLGYREEDRIRQIKRIQNLAKLLSDQSLVVLVAALYSSPELLAWNRNSFRNYFEVYLKASLNTLAGRDTKGLYEGSASGSIPNVVGADIPWHEPQSPDMVINTDNPGAPDQLARRVIESIPLLSHRQR